MSEITTFEGYILRRTQKGLLFHGNYWEAPLWFPMSQTVIEEDPDAMEHVVKVRSWLCRKKGLNEFCFYSEKEIEQIMEM